MTRRDVIALRPVSRAKRFFVADPFARNVSNVYIGVHTKPSAEFCKPNREMEELTPRQASVLSYVEKYFRQHQQAPTEREIAGHFGINQSAARKHLKALERKGRIEMRLDGTSRGIRLNTIQPTVSVPIVGRVQAGLPLLAEENLEGRVMLDFSMVGSEQTFLLRVKGDSMVDAGIIEDDLLLVRRAESVRSGEIVVARIGDETTVKRFYDIAGRVFLEPANKNYSPIMVEEPEDFHLEGRVVALIRDMRNLEVRRKEPSGGFAAS